MTPEIARDVITLANVSRPEVLSYGAISDLVRVREMRRTGRGLVLGEKLVFRLIRKHAPHLFAQRAASRASAQRPRPLSHDGRKRRLDARLRALIVAKSRQLVERADGSISPAYPLTALGKLSPQPLGRLQVRRLLLAEPDGRELLRARLDARRGKLTARSE